MKHLNATGGEGKQRPTEAPMKAPAKAPARKSK